MTTKRIAVLSAAALAIAAAAVAGAAPVTVPNTFAPGAAASASQVNANFTAVKGAVDDNHARITSLETQVTAWNAFLTALSAQCERQYREITGTESHVYGVFLLRDRLPAGFKGHFIAAAGARGSGLTGHQVCALVTSPWSWLFGDGNGAGRCAGVIWARPLTVAPATGAWKAIWAEKAPEVDDPCDVAPQWADLVNAGGVACCY